MSMAPVYLREAFANRDILVILLKLMDVTDQFEVQVRAFEAAYFLTVACQSKEAELLWESVELLPRMWKSAIMKRKRMPQKMQEDVLFEMSLRTTALVTKKELLVDQLLYLAELDMFMLGMFEDGTKGEDLLHCTSHLMNLLLQVFVCLVEVLLLGCI